MRGEGEREAEAGGIPRHSDHPGFGLRDLRRSLAGPEYARRLVEAASSARAEIRTEATVTGWADELSLEVTSPRGRLRVNARTLVLGGMNHDKTVRILREYTPNIEFAARTWVPK